MILTPAERNAVRDSYAAIVRDAPAYSSLFYHRLLQRHPFTRALFPDDLRHQIHIFRVTIDTLVDRIDDLDAIGPDLRALAARHAGYGVVPVHFDAVGDVLIDTFAEILGDRFTAATREAWSTLYRRTTALMLEGRSARPDARRAARGSSR